MIPYGRQEISQDDIDAVVTVLKSDFLTQGPAVEALERRIASYCDVRYAVAVSSATAGLHIAYQALGLKQGMRLWTTPNTFVATANAALYCGASVDFVDIDPFTYNMAVPALRMKLEQADKKGSLPDIVAPVHFSGQSCQLDEIKALSQQYGFLIVEDAAHCIGADFNGRKIGSCAYSNAAIFSTHPVKIITTGEGGIVTTNDEQMYQALLRLRTHGITRDPHLMQNKNEGAWYFEQVDLGYHYRITDMQCALGLSQMERLDSYVERRRALVARYNEKLAGLPIKLPYLQENCNSSWHLYVVVLKNESLSRREVFDRMRAKNIGVNVHYIPVYRHPYFHQFNYNPRNFPETEAYYNQALTLPLYPALTHEEQDYICEELAGIITGGF